MPQITLEHSSNIKAENSYQQIFSEIHQVMSLLPNLKVESCKSRIKVSKEYLIGYGTVDDGFVHLEIKLIEGRDDKVKSEVAKKLTDTLRKHFPTSKNPRNLQIAVEFKDLKRTNYFKS